MNRPLAVGAVDLDEGTRRSQLLRRPRPLRDLGDGATCEGDTLRYDKVPARCVSHLFIFNGSELRVLDRGYREVAREVYDGGSVALRRGETHAMRLAVPAIDAWLRIGGIVYIY